LVRSSQSPSFTKSSILIALALAIAALYLAVRFLFLWHWPFVLSFLLTPLVGLLERIRLGRVPAVLVVLVFCFALTAGASWLVAGQLLDITGHIGDYKTILRKPFALSIRRLVAPLGKRPQQYKS